MKMYKRLPNNANATQINRMGYTLKEADPDLRYCPHCEGWIDQRPEPYQDVLHVNPRGASMDGTTYKCGRCDTLIAFIPDPLPTREGLREKIPHIRQLLEALNTGEMDAFRNMQMKDMRAALSLLDEFEKFTWFGV